MKRRCLRDTLWFLGLTDSLCFAAVLSKQGPVCGTASRLMDSMVPVGGRARLDLGDFAGGLLGGGGGTAGWVAWTYTNIIYSKRTPETLDFNKVHLGLVGPLALVLVALFQPGPVPSEGSWGPLPHPNCPHLLHFSSEMDAAQTLYFVQSASV